MKRIVTLFLSLILLLSCLCAPASALFDPSLFYEVQARSAYIVNTDTNIIVYDKDSSRQVPAGGLTKYMTIALLLTNYADQLDNTFQMPFAISDYVHNSDNADMRSNETFTYREAVYAMLLRNANEAAMGLAYSLSGGDLAGWVSQMNTLSQRIGTTGSTWTDACGLDSGNVTTAVDMYLILRYLMSFDAFVDISSAPAFTMPAKEKHTKSFVLLNQNVKLRNFFRTVAFFPYVASLVAVAAVWNMIFNPSMGPINMILNQFFGVAVENLPRWAAGKDTAMITVILFSVWKNMGYYMVIYLAGLQGCNPDLNEAAELDGANRWQQFWHITLPQLRPTTFFVVIMLTISGFKVYDQMYMITQGGPGTATMTLVYYIYNVAFVNTPKYGYASAISMVLFVLVLIVTIIQFRGSKGEN